MNLREATLIEDRALAVLDFPAIRQALMRHAQTDRGRSQIEQLVPFATLSEIRAEQSATVEMRRLVEAANFSIGRVTEVAPAVERAQRESQLSGEELRDIGRAMAAANAALRRVRAADAPTLQQRCTGAQVLDQLVGALAQALDERGVVLDRASPELGRIRRQIAHAQNEARESVMAITRAARYARALQESIVTMREGRYVVPVKAEMSNIVPGIVHDTSSSGQTLFVEPLAALEANNRVRTLRFEEEREVARILTALTATVGSEHATITRNLEVLVTLDLSLAKARVANEMHAVAPEIVEGAEIELEHARHPLLGERGVAQSIRLDEIQRVLVISGPNMGGKTVALKLVGLALVLAYCGMALPTRGRSRIGYFTRIFVDLGDEQSIAQNASTFSMRLRRLREILAGADARALVLVDELASGTEPTAGAALAIAALEHLLKQHARAIVTTHATELKLFAHGADGVQNASVRFEPVTHAPTYELEVGVPGQSLAFPLARAQGLDEALILRAEELLSTSEREYDRALNELAQTRAEAAAERTALAAERHELQRAKTEAETRAAALAQAQRRLATETEERLSRALREFGAELERRAAERSGNRTRITAGEAALLGRTIESVQQDLGISATPTEERRPLRVKVGEKVYVESLGRDGTVIEDQGDRALVSVGPLKTIVEKRALRPAGSGPAPTPRRIERTASAVTLRAASETPAQLDVRGKRFTEAEPVVDRWINDAALASLSPLKLVHGKGTGALGRALQQYLREHPAVSNLRYGELNEGGSGVTVLELR